MFLKQDDCRKTQFVKTKVAGAPRCLHFCKHFCVIRNLATLRPLFNSLELRRCADHQRAKLMSPPSFKRVSNWSHFVNFCGTKVSQFVNPFGTKAKQHFLRAWSKRDKSRNSTILSPGLTRWVGSAAR
jgi:hypothetical protein